MSSILMYALLAVGLVVAVKSLQKFQNESKPKPKRNPLHSKSSVERDRKAQERLTRAKRLGEKIRSYGPRLEQANGSTRRSALLAKAQREIDELAKVEKAGLRQMEKLLPNVGPEELWRALLKSLWKTYDKGGMKAIDKVHFLTTVTEDGMTPQRTWALSELPGLLGNSSTLWELALPAIATCWKDQDRRVAEAAGKVLEPFGEHGAQWARDLLTRSIETSTSRPLLLYSVSAAERWESPEDVGRAMRSTCICFENVLDGEVRAALIRALRVHKGKCSDLYEEVVAGLNPALKATVMHEVADVRKAAY